MDEENNYGLLSPNTTYGPQKPKAPKATKTPTAEDYTNRSKMSRRKAMLKDTGAFSDGRTVKSKSYGMKMGSKQIDSPSTFSTKDFSNLSKAPSFKDNSKASKRATKMAHLRNKGEDAIASGNQAKAKRLRNRYDRQKKRLSKS